MYRHVFKQYGCNEVAELKHKRLRDYLCNYCVARHFGRSWKVSHRIASHATCCKLRTVIMETLFSIKMVI